jgi:ABC-type uncharacterized transport system ATPase subunit
MIIADQLNKHFKIYETKKGFIGSFTSLLSTKHHVVKAVNDISFNIQEGEFVGYIGPNGAGKQQRLKCCLVFCIQLAEASKWQVSVLKKEEKTWPKR